MNRNSIKDIYNYLCGKTYIYRYGQNDICFIPFDGKTAGRRDMLNEIKDNLDLEPFDRVFREEYPEFHQLADGLFYPEYCHFVFFNYRDLLYALRLQLCAAYIQGKDDPGRAFSQFVRLARCGGAHLGSTQRQRLKDDIAARCFETSEHFNFDEFSPEWDLRKSAEYAEMLPVFESLCEQEAIRKQEAEQVYKDRILAQIDRSNSFYSRVYVDYKTYINSPEWQVKRLERLKLDHCQCQFCGSAVNVEVHHLTYRRLGHEDINDLITLCDNCHRSVHWEDIRRKIAKARGLEGHA